MDKPAMLAQVTSLQLRAEKLMKAPWQFAHMGPSLITELFALLIAVINKLPEDPS
jgi:hypothetical protein